jgi:branched-subunit amino acid aminotransferase/4-amino-4-deoxychorismate lyase
MHSGKFVLFNGNILSWDEPVLMLTNRAFHFGDGIFESIRVMNGLPLFVSTHFSRITEGLKALKIELPDKWSEVKLENELKTLIDKNEIKEGARIRLTLYRSSEGFYLPTSNSLSYLAEIIPYNLDRFQLNENGLLVDIYSDIKKQVNLLSAFKTLNCQNYILASLYAKDKNFNDVFLLNDKGNIIETTNSNFFIVSNGVLYTPAVTDGCIGGTMRMHIINIAIDNKVKVYEASLTPQHLLTADELFLTNAIKGVQWVSGYRQKRYFHKMSDFLIEKLNQLVSSKMEN